MPKIKSIKEMVQEKRRVIYRVIARCLREGDKMSYAGDTYTDDDCPDYVRSEAKDAAQIIETYEQQLKSQIAQAEQMLKGYGSDKRQSEMLQKQIQDLQLELKAIDNADPMEIAKKINIAVIMTVE